MKENWKARYDRMKRVNKWTDTDVAQITGLKPDSIKTLVNGKDFPRWGKLAIIAFEKASGITPDDLL